MKRIAFVAIGLLFANLSEAADWCLEIEPIWMDVYGNDVHVGDIFKYKQIFTVDEFGGWTVKYGIEYEPINLIMKNNLALRFALNYQKNQWGLNISGWGFRTGVWENGYVTTPPMEYITGGYVGYIYGIRMWDHTLIPVVNELEVSKFSPVKWWATNKLSVYTFDFLAINTLIKDLDLMLGLKIGKLANERFESQTQHAYVNWGAPFYVICDNHITLESTSKGDYLLTGPTLGIQTKIKLGDNIGFNGFLKQAFLFGQGQSSGIWIDIDDIDWKNLAGELIYHDYYKGQFTFTKLERIALPVTEFKLGFNFNLNKKMRLGLGIFGSIWWQAPVAPKWSVPGDWTCVEGTNWQCQKETLFFYGTGLTFAFKL